MGGIFASATFQNQSIHMVSSFPDCLSCRCTHAATIGSAAWEATATALITLHLVVSTAAGGRSAAIEMPCAVLGTAAATVRPRHTKLNFSPCCDIRENVKCSTWPAVPNGSQTFRDRGCCCCLTSESLKFALSCSQV